MSFAEVLAAANELTADERRELARELNGSSDDGIPEQLRPFIPLPGSVAEYWHVTTDEAGWEVIDKMLAEMKSGGVS